MVLSRSLLIWGNCHKNLGRFWIAKVYLDSMGRMYIQPTEEEFDISVERFLNTYTEFERAAKKLTAIMESMNKKRY